VDGLCSPDVLVELPAVLTVVMAVVLGGNLDVLPAHVQDRDKEAVLVVDRDLSGRQREPGANEQQSGQCRLSLGVRRQPGFRDLLTIARPRGHG